MSISVETIYSGIKTIQHRGQDSWGIVLESHTGENSIQRGIGLIPDIAEIAVITGCHVCLAHVRYSTSTSTDGGDLTNAQPIRLSSIFDIYIAHNGNIPNIHAGLAKLGITIPDIYSDTHVFRVLWETLYDKIGDDAEIQAFIRYVYHVIPGAYSCVILKGHGQEHGAICTLYGFRDRYGMKPLCVATTACNFYIASESVQLDGLVDFTASGVLQHVECGYFYKITSSEIQKINMTHVDSNSNSIML